MWENGPSNSSSGRTITATDPNPTEKHQTEHVNEMFELKLYNVSTTFTIHLIENDQCRCHNF